MGVLTEFVAHNYIFQPPHMVHDVTNKPKSRKDVFVECPNGNMIHTQLVTAFDDKTEFPSRGDDTWDTCKTVLLFSHGNSDDNKNIQSYCTWLADRLNVLVVSWDPPGYGFSTACTTSEENMNEAILAVYSFLRTTLQHPNEKIVLMGKSLGSVPTIDLSMRVYEPLQGIVLVSPIASGLRVLVSQKLMSFMPKWVSTQMDFCFAPNLYKIREVSSAVLFVHGSDDRVVSVDNTYALCREVPFKYSVPALILSKAGHNNIEERYSDQFLSTLFDFIWRQKSTCDYDKKSETQHDDINRN